MNIANIFGLHLGCRIKFKQSSSDNYTGIGHLSAVKNGWVEISVDPDDTRLWYDCSDCKIILKPLSKITDEDKAEFQKKYVKVNDFVSRLRVEFYNNLSYDVYKRSTSGWSENTEHKLSIDQLLWLCSKGYDIGLVPDEYKEVEE